MPDPVGREATPCAATFRVGVLRRVRCQREAGHNGWHVQSVEWKDGPRPSPPARETT